MESLKLTKLWMPYKHITDFESISIEIYLKEWLNYSEVARKLWRNPSTIKREVDRYKSIKTWRYNSKTAIRLRKLKRIIVNKNNKQRIKDDDNSDFLIKYITSKIKKYWSPEQISWRLKKDEDIIISKDTIYKFIYENHPGLIKKYFRRKWKKYQHNKKERYQLNWRKMIESRPKIVETRSRIWDWEWDTVIWTRWWNKEVILTNVDRKSWLLLARKIKDKSWNSVLEWTLDCFKRIPKYKKITMTYDNWKEFSEHSMIQYLTNLDVYFANPYASWERWTNENTNWLLRQFLPKKTDFQNISENQLKFYVSLINSRPRKRLNYLTPYEVFYWS